MLHFLVAVFTRTDSPEELENLLAPFNELAPLGSRSLEFVEDNDLSYDKKAGKHGCWINPYAKWDSWSFGGRWRGELKLKEGRTGRYGKTEWPNTTEPTDMTHCDSAKVRDCDFIPNEAVYRSATRFWEVVVEGKPLRKGEDKAEFMAFYNERFYIEKYGTKEQFAHSSSHFYPHSYLTADGEWNVMGWFGLDDSTVESRKTYEANFSAYLKVAEEQDLYITIVDCHI